MVRKYIFILLVSFLFVGCQSNKFEPTYFPTKAAVIPPQDNSTNNTRLNPKIEIEIKSPDEVVLSVSYSAINWAFIDGIELKNGAGDVLRYGIKPKRTVLDSGSITEIGVIILYNYNNDFMTSQSATKLRDFLAVGNITGRPVADNKIFSFGQVIIN